MHKGHLGLLFLFFSLFSSHFIMIPPFFVSVLIVPHENSTRSNRPRELELEHWVGQADFGVEGHWDSHTYHALM